jgi:hypothetical protein
MVHAASAPLRSADLGNWTTTSRGVGVSWNGSDDADGCSTSGSASFVDGGGVHYCFKAAVEGTTYYLGMKGKGYVGCIVVHILGGFRYTGRHGWHRGAQY